MVVLGNSVSDRLAARLPFYYGYVMIPVAMMIQISTSPGQTFAIAAFIPEIRQSLNLSDSQMSLAYMLGTFLAAFPLSTIGPLADRLGLRRLTILAVIALAAACCLAARQWLCNAAAGVFLFAILGTRVPVAAECQLDRDVVSHADRSRVGRDEHWRRDRVRLDPRVNQPIDRFPWLARDLSRDQHDRARDHAAGDAVAVS